MRSRWLTVVGLLACSGGKPERPPHYIPSVPTDTGADEEDTGTPDTDDPVASDLPDWLTGTDVVPCENPAAGVSYEEVGEELGLMGRVSEVFEHTESGAVSVADLDSDGDLDIILSFIYEGAWAYFREGDGFIAEELPRTSEFQAMGVVDVDMDGHLDIAVAGPDPAITTRVDGEWVHTLLPVAEEGDLSSVTKALVPGDIDNDGDLDLYAVRSSVGPESSRGLDHVYINDGEGNYSLDLTIVPDTEQYRRGFDAKWFDVDGDGWQDVFVVNERWSAEGPTPGRDGTFLLRNSEGELRRDDQDCHCELVLDGMGVDITDLNGDGRPDIYVSASMNNVLLQQFDDGSYVDVSLVTGADPLDGTLLTMSWGALFLDFNNDGLQDILVAEGDLWHEFSTNPVIVDLPIDLLQQVESSSGMSFEAVGAEYGMELYGSWRSIVALDHNGDGLVDPLITDVEARPRFFMSQGCTSNGWLRVEAPVHSRVEVRADDRTQVFWVDTHSSFGAGTQPEVHVGLGATDVVESLIVDLPTGERLETSAPFMGRRKVWVR